MTPTHAERSIDDFRARLAAMSRALDAGDRRSFEAELRVLAERPDVAAMGEIRHAAEDLLATLGRFRVESRVDELAQTDVPDARHRLEHVLRMTDAAAHATLDIVERSRLIAERTATGAARLLLDLDAGRQTASPEVRAFLAAASHDAALVHEHLAGVLLAQEYQDLTGQIILRVVALVDDVEGVLTRLVRLSANDAAWPPRLPAEIAGDCCGPAVPHVGSGFVVGVQGDVDALLLEYGR